MHGGICKELVDFLLGRNPQVSHAEVSVLKKPGNIYKRAARTSSDDFRAIERRMPDYEISARAAGPFSVVSGTRESCAHENSGFRVRRLY